MTVEPITDADVARWEAAAEAYDPPEFLVPPDELRAFVARLRAAEAVRARALPEPRQMRTVEEVRALPRGNYLVQLAGETRTRAVERHGFYPGWLETGRPNDRLDAALVGALVSGPLPDLHIPTTAQEGQGNG